MRDSSGPALVLSGYRYGDSSNSQDSSGYYWASMAGSNNFAYDLNVNSSNVDPVDDSRKFNGFSIRCVAQLLAPLTRVVTLCRWYCLDTTIGITLFC